MARCTKCGRTLDMPGPRKRCAECATAPAAAAGGASSGSGARADDAGPDERAADRLGEDDDPTPAADMPAAVAAALLQLRDFAAIAGDDLADREALIARALANGNDRPYRAELNRLANRYLDELERSWV